MKFVLGIVFFVVVVWIGIAGSLLYVKHFPATPTKLVEFDFRGMRIGDSLPIALAKKEKITGIGIEYAYDRIKDDDFWADVTYGLVDGKIEHFRITFDRHIPNELELKYGKPHRKRSDPVESEWSTTDGELIYDLKRSELQISSRVYSEACSAEYDADTKRRASKL